MLNFFKTILALSVLFLSIGANAIDQGDFRLSGLVGNTSLLGDVGNGGQNAIGYGGGFSYLIADDMAFNILYSESSHKNDVNHSDLSLGVDYYTGGDDIMAIYISGGLGFLSNKIEAVKVAALTGSSVASVSDVTGSGMAIFLGTGVDFAVGKAMNFGMRFKYNKAFEATETVNNVEIKTMQDSVDVLAVISFVMPSKGW
ncbi:MAG: hypothetical protein SGJ18_06150 [Pseudomonadota bacterium]|nr:hypothetical protein [Pseudomonadota bacterium]